MQDCPEEFDQTKREAMFAFRTTDLGSNDQSSAVIKELKEHLDKKIKLENQGYTLVKSWTEYPDIWVSMYEYQKKEVA